MIRIKVKRINGVDIRIIIGMGGRISYERLIDFYGRASAINKVKINFNKYIEAAARLDAALWGE